MFIVFDISSPSFYRGKVATLFNELSEGGGKPWFFQPAEWVPHPSSAWYGSFLNTRIKTLMPYSLGYATPEEARKAAHQWSCETYGADCEVIVKES